MSKAENAGVLRAEIRRRFGSVHRFCKQHKGRVNRATVYMVLAGTYPGNASRQMAKMFELLGTSQNLEERVMEAIKRVACSRCAVTTRPCPRCDGLFRAQAAAAAAALAAEA